LPQVPKDLSWLNRLANIRFLSFLVLSACCNQANGQTSIQFNTSDTVFVTDHVSNRMFGTVYISTSVNRLIAEWEMDFDSMPSDWALISLCDNVFCYFSPVPRKSSLDTILKTDSAFANLFELTIQAPSNGKAVFAFTFKKIETSDSAKLTYVFERKELNQDNKVHSVAYRHYPNPVENVVFIKMNDGDAASYKLVDRLGQQLIQGELHSKTIDLTNLISGIYYITVTTSMGKSSTFPIVKL
jgi:hypothetical protein